jgi:Leucine-rich repeat (LRR) protein
LRISETSNRWISQTTSSRALLARFHLIILLALIYIPALRPLIHLRELNAANNRICELTGIQELDSLTVVNLRCNQITEIGLQKSQLQELRVLNLSNNKIRVFGSIESLVSLQELYLGKLLVY